MPDMKGSFFNRFAKHAAIVTGKPITFVCAVSVIIGWALLGPFFGFSDTWQLVINTGTTIVTFLMVFLIQNTQNRDGEAVQIKLDEIIRSIRGARNQVMNLEEMDEKQLDAIRKEYYDLAEAADEKLGKRSNR
jgi:low affinity Fe/Cu permease